MAGVGEAQGPNTGNQCQQLWSHQQVKYLENVTYSEFRLEQSCHVLATLCHNPVYALKADINFSASSNWNLAF